MAAHLRLHDGNHTKQSEHAQAPLIVKRTSPLRDVNEYHYECWRRGALHNLVDWLKDVACRVGCRSVAGDDRTGLRRQFRRRLIASMSRSVKPRLCRASQHPKAG